MSFSLDQILPSLQAFGVVGYWLIGLASMLEAFFLSGIVVPGTLIVDAGGILVQRGLLDFFDLAWFVAIGSVLGSELSYWTGRLAMNRLPGQQRLGRSAGFIRAQALFEKRGGLALVIGRFLGPVSGLVPLAAGMAGMERRHFLIWNLAGSLPFALAHVSLGYFLGDVMGRIGGSLTRMTVLVAVVGLLLILLWSLLYSALRLLPLAWTVLLAVLRNLADIPAVARQIEIHPQAAHWARARIDSTAFTGLPLSFLAVISLYIGAVWLESVLEFLTGNPILQFDMRLAELIHHFQSPIPIRIASLVTALGAWQVVMPLTGAALTWLLLTRRHGLATGLIVSVVGNALSVALLKRAFGRPRSPLGVFAETSGSFPSGHAAASVAALGMLIYVLWRAERLRAETALLLAGLVAFVIGVSRIYLIEHYLSDVLNGWLVGALWLTLGIAVAEWQLSLKSRAALPGPAFSGPGIARIGGPALIVGLIALAGLNVWRYDHPRNAPVQTVDHLLPDRNALSAVDGFPAVTESLIGSPVHPVSLIVFARNEAALSGAMIASGWATSRPPTPHLVLDALFAAIKRNQDPTVETVAHFWRGQPDELAFVRRAQGDGTVSPSDPKTRFWRTGYVTGDGLRAFVGTIGTDQQGKALPRPGQDGDLSHRDALVQLLLAHGASDPGHIELPGQRIGSHIAGPVNAVMLSIR